MANGRTFAVVLVTCLVSTAAVLPAQGAPRSGARHLTQTKPNKPVDVKAGDSASSVFKRLGKYNNGRHLLAAEAGLHGTAASRSLAQTKPNKPVDVKAGDSASSVFKRLGKYNNGRHLLAAEADVAQAVSSSRHLAQTKPNKPVDVKAGDSASSVFKRLGKYNNGR